MRVEIVSDLDPEGNDRASASNARGDEEPRLGTAAAGACARSGGDD